MRRARPLLGRRPQQGAVRVSAEHVCGRSRLVSLASGSPARLLPLHPAAAERAGAAWCSLATFGGGLLGGDTLDAEVRVGPGAVLSIITQGPGRVYHTKRDEQPAVQRLCADIGAGGLLVLAPDAIVPFAGAAYEQHQCFRLAASDGLPQGASVVVVDWLSAGRVACGERWAFDSYFSRSQYDLHQPGGSAAEGSEQAPWIVEALALRPGGGGAGGAEDLEAGALDAVASVVALGPRAGEVAARLLGASAALAARAGARVAAPPGGGGAPGLAGRAHMGATAVPERGAAAGGAPRPPECGGAVARIVAEHTDDVYRVLHFCLEPLSRHLGAAPYADRLHGLGAAAGPAPPRAAPRARGGGEPPAPPAPGTAGPRGPGAAPLGPAQQAALLQLADSALPTGAFAHSGGLEAAAQLGLFRGPGGAAALRAFLLAGARSSHRLHGAFAAAAHAAAGAEPSLGQWRRLDALLQAHLAANAVACRASREQGAALARALAHWTAGVPAGAAAGRPPAGHLATVFGLAGALLGLPLQTTLQALSHCGLRDAVSAAVRLNLVGPLAGVALQAGLLRELAPEVAAAPAGGLPAAAPSAPLVDCAQAAHGLLHARLFLT